jgi:DNA-nicking Smr family endonuclease
MEIDLHDYSYDEALEVLIERCNALVARGQRGPIKVIHGYGSLGKGGVLRRRLRAFLASYPQSVLFVAGEQIDGNPGYTMVYPLRRLPTRADELHHELLVYCTAPRSEEKIVGKFRRKGYAAVQQALRKLMSEGKLIKLRKGKYTCYQAVEREI